MIWSSWMKLGLVRIQKKGLPWLYPFWTTSANRVASPWYPPTTMSLKIMPTTRKELKMAMWNSMNEPYGQPIVSISVWRGHRMLYLLRPA